jgi:formamidopyrimidine-DNA glycosylase
VLAPGSVGVVPAKALRDAVAGRRFVGTERRGKNLLVQTDGGPWVAMHFGMTGHLESLDAGDPRPKQDRVEFVFADAGRLAFVVQRRFGGVRLVPDPEAFFAGKKLGPDALTLKPRQVAELLGRRRGAVKGVLMDQSVIAGLGNLYADEVLFQAGVNPKRRVEDLSVEELRRIGEQTGKVLRKAIEAHVEARRMPDTWLLRHRREGEVCPLAGGTVRRTKVAGRTTYYCDERQPERA